MTFFETGAAPSKNADAMRKVLEALNIDDDDGSDDGSDVEMEDTHKIPLPLIEPSPSKEKKKKEGKEKERKKKRKSEAMEIDEEGLSVSYAGTVRRRC